MAECNQLSCPDPATHTVHWPGGSKTMCDRHAQIAINLARSMGFEVTTERLAPPADTLTLPRAVVEGARDAFNHVRMCRECAEMDASTHPEGREALDAIATLDAALLKGGG